MARTALTKGGKPSAAGRRAAEAAGQSMPGGRFPIRNPRELVKAKHAFGRSKTPGATRAFINKRARALGKPPLGGSKGK